MKKNKFFLLIVILIAIFIFGTGALCNSCSTIIGNAILSSETLQTSNQTDAEQNQNQQDSAAASDTASNTEDSQKQVEAEKEKESILAEESIKQSSDSQTQNSGFNDTGDDRFVLSFNTMNPKDDTTIPTYAQVRKYYLDLGIPESNLFTYWGWYSDGGTYENFENSINKIASKSDENSIIYINILSHGSEGPPSSMEFANGEGNQHYGPVIDYSEISKMLDKIECSRMIVIAHSCALSTSVEPLTSNPAYPRVAMAPVTEPEVLLYIIEGSWNIDRDGDGKISIQEVYNFLKDPNDTANPARYTELEMIDNFNIAKDIFLK
jgi:Sec-independent protein translocase protein TatA